MVTHQVQVTVPSVPFGPEGVEPRVADASYFRSAARNIRFHKQRGQSFSGSNVTETVAALCEAAADALEASVDVACDGRCLDGPSVGVQGEGIAVPDHRCSLHGLHHVERERDEAIRKLDALKKHIGHHAFGVAVPGAREKDPSHNGAHDVVKVDGLRAILDATDPIAIQSYEPAADVEVLAAGIHEAREFYSAICDHGTYVAGPSRGEPYAMCVLAAQRIIERRNGGA